MTRLTAAQEKTLELLRSNPEATHMEQLKFGRSTTFNVLLREGVIVYVELLPGVSKFFIYEGQSCELTEEYFMNKDDDNYSYTGDPEVEARAKDWMNGDLDEQLAGLTPEPEYIHLTLSSGHTFFGLNVDVDADWQQCMWKQVSSYTSDLLGLYNWCDAVGVDYKSLRTVDQVKHALFEKLVLSELESEQSKANEEVEQSGVDIMEAWRQRQRKLGYCVGFTEVSQRVPRRVNRRASRFFNYLAA